jgi:hypothetical protein
VVDWIRLAQDRNRWRAVVSAVMNLRVLSPRSYLLLLFLLTSEGSDYVSELRPPNGPNCSSPDNI